MAYGYDPAQFGAQRVQIMQQSAAQIGASLQSLGQNVGKVVAGAKKQQEGDALLYTQAKSARTALVNCIDLMAKYDPAAAEAIRAKGATSAVELIPQAPRTSKDRQALATYADQTTRNLNGIWTQLALRDDVPTAELAQAAGIPGLTEETRTAIRESIKRGTQQQRTGAEEQGIQQTAQAAMAGRQVTPTGETMASGAPITRIEATGAPKSTEQFHQRFAEQAQQLLPKTVTTQRLGESPAYTEAVKGLTSEMQQQKAETDRLKVEKSVAKEKVDLTNLKLQLQNWKDRDQARGKLESEQNRLAAKADAYRIDAARARSGVPNDPDDMSAGWKAPPNEELALAYEQAAGELDEMAGRKGERAAGYILPTGQTGSYPAGASTRVGMPRPGETGGGSAAPVPAKRSRFTVTEVKP